MRKDSQEIFKQRKREAVETTRTCCSDSWGGKEREHFSTCSCVCLCVCLLARVREEVVVLGERGVFFFHPVGPQAGLG